MSAAFTKGPWHCGDEDEFITGLEYVQVHSGSYGDETFREIASVEAPFAGLDDETRANAHLISSAPDLYEALLRVVAIADRKTVEFDAARMALSKARGEQSL